MNEMTIEEILGHPVEKKCRRAAIDTFYGITDLCCGVEPECRKCKAYTGKYRSHESAVKLLVSIRGKS